MQAELPQTRQLHHEIYYFSGKAEKLVDESSTFEGKELCSWSAQVPRDLVPIAIDKEGSGQGSRIGTLWSPYILKRSAGQ